MCGRNTVAVTGRSVVLRRVSCRKSAMSHQFVVRPRNKTAVGPGRTSRRTSRRRSSTRHSTTPTARKIARAWWAATWLRACASEPILRCATALCLRLQSGTLRLPNRPPLLILFFDCWDERAFWRGVNTTLRCNSTRFPGYSSMR